MGEEAPEVSILSVTRAIASAQDTGAETDKRHRQTDRQTANRETGTETDRRKVQADRQAERQTGRETNKTGRQIDGQDTEIATALNSPLTRWHPACLRPPGDP